MTLLLKWVADIWLEVVVWLTDGMVYLEDVRIGYPLLTCLAVFLLANSFLSISVLLAEQADEDVALQVVGALLEVSSMSILLQHSCNWSLLYTLLTYRSPFGRNIYSSSSRLKRTLRMFTVRWWLLVLL